MEPDMRARVTRTAAAILGAGGAGIALVALSSAAALDAVGIVLVGVALVGAVAAVFYEVGASEDREREEAERGRREDRAG